MKKPKHKFPDKNKKKISKSKIYLCSPGKRGL